MKWKLAAACVGVFALVIWWVAKRPGGDTDSGTPPTREAIEAGAVQGTVPGMPPPAGETSGAPPTASAPPETGDAAPGTDPGVDPAVPDASLSPPDLTPPPGFPETGTAALPGREPDEDPRPPMDGPPEGPPSLASEMHYLMRQVREGGGPPLDEHAEAMMVSEDPLLRAVGAALLNATGEISTEVLQQIAADPDAQVPLMLIGWLEDTGNAEQALALAEMLRAQGIGGAELADLVASRGLDSVGARAALDLMRNAIPADDLAHVLSETAIDMEQDHAVRMKALLLLRDTLSFEDYRTEVDLIAENTQGIDPLWDESLQRKRNQLQGPVEILDQPPELNTSLIDERLAREYPAMLGDLALYVEYVLEHDDGVAAAGTADTLQGYVDTFGNRPWTSDQQFELTRLGAMIEDLRTLEAATRDRARDDHPPF